MSKVLIVSNDTQIARSLDFILTLYGFVVHVAPRIYDAWVSLKEIHFDIVLLDNHLRDGSSLEFCRSVRRDGSHIPILMFRDHSDDDFKLHEMNLGAVDFVLKPLRVKELKNSMNKLMKKNSENEKLIVYGDLKIDMARQLVMVKDKIISLGRKEMGILIMLAKKTGSIVSREKLLSAIEDGPHMIDKTVYWHVSHLRKKLKGTVGEALKISSVYGQGYRLEFA